MGTLAAGYKLRVLLAQVLFGHPDVLLLDEPTNHLDLESIRWLETFLIDEFKGTLVVVSHDRHFLNEVATHIADVDYRTVTVYTGGYDDFIAQKYENKQRADATAAAAKKKKEELQEFVQRFGSHASKSKQAQSRLKQMEKLDDVIETKGSKKSSLVRPFIRFEFDKPSGRDVLRMEAVSKAFGEKVIYRDLNVNVNRGDKIAVIGPNGIGKSTLLKLMVGGSQGVDAETKKETLQPDPPAKGKAEKPEVRWGHETSVGYFAQDHHEALGQSAKGMTAFQWLYSFDPQAAQEDVRSILGKLLFSGDAALKPTEALSGGEAARLLIAKLILKKHNVLVLDEPTNHLDLYTKEMLIEALGGYEGTMLFVSHDRHFLRALSNRVLEVDHGDVRRFGGGYSEYVNETGHEAPGVHT
jgi:ATPase subunit of ABC transporter with duplicated ATPase domains